MRNAVGLILLALVWGSSACFADFKYTESVEVSGGVMEGMMDFWNSFSQQPTGPLVVTHYLKGNRLRTEESEGKVLIIDLDARSLTEIDPRQHTYAVLSFDDLQAALKKMQAEAEAGAGKMVPKVDVAKTDNAKILHQQNTHEILVQLELQHPGEGVQARRPSLRITSDVWLVEANPGFEEMRKFSQQLAQELDWVPGTTLTGNLEMTQAMVELRKSVAALDGLPILQRASIATIAPPTPPPAPAAPASAPNPAQPSAAGQTPSKAGVGADTAVAALVPQVAIAKGIMGLLGKKKKKAAEAAAPTVAQPAANPPPPAAAPSTPPASQEQAAGGLAGTTLAEVTVEVTSFSSGPLNAALFKAPPGYRQVKASAEQLLGEKAELGSEVLAEKHPPGASTASGDKQRDPAAPTDKGNKADASKAQGTKQP